MIDEKKRNYYKQLLLNIRDENLKKYYENEQTLSSNVKEASGEHSSYSFHMADMGSDSIERETSFMIASMESGLLREVEYALSKIDNGDYGYCESCNQEINEMRLEAIPHARLCLDCKMKHETR